MRSNGKLTNLFKALGQKPCTRITYMYMYITNLYINTCSTNVINFCILFTILQSFLDFLKAKDINICPQELEKINFKVQRNCANR